MEKSAYTERATGCLIAESLALCLDREGTLWAGTMERSRSIHRRQSHSLHNQRRPVEQQRRTSARRSCRSSLDRTLGHGLDFFDGRSFQNLSMRNGLSSDAILSLALDTSGDVWVGTANGLDRVRGTRVVDSLDHRGPSWSGSTESLCRHAGNSLGGT